MDPLAEVELCSGFPAALLDRPGPADAEEIPSHGHRSHQKPRAAQVTSVGSGEVAAELLPAEAHPGIPLEPAHQPLWSLPCPLLHRDLKRPRQKCTEMSLPQQS